MGAIFKIVLIDDDNELSEVVKHNLSALYDLVCFEEPNAALEYLKHHYVSGVILDYHLEHTNGISVAWELIEKFPLTPILFVSADRSVKERISELEFPHVLYLPKPFVGSELRSCMVKLLRSVSQVQPPHLNF